MFIRLDQLLTKTSIAAENVAILHQQQTWSYGELNALVQQQARALCGIGLKPRQRVAIYLPKQIEAISSLLAISLAGGVFVPVNPVLKAAQVCHIISDCEVQVLITSSSRLALLGNLDNFPYLQTIILAENSPFSIECQMQSILAWQDFLAYASNSDSTTNTSSVDTDMAAILYTSGSTGKSKGVVLSHRNLLVGAASVAEYLNITEHDRLLAVLPFSFDYGLNQLTTALLTGASCVLMDYLLPRDVLNALVTYQITGLAAVPPLWIQLANLQWPESINQHLRFMTNSGGKLPENILHKIRTQIPNAAFFLMYGLTEAFRSTYLPSEQLMQRPNSIGKAIPNADVLVVRPDGSRCQANEPGELVHRGPLVSLGYWNDVEKTAERFKPAPGYIKELPFPEIAVWSGDTVVQDKEGYFYFIERNDEMIKTSGYRVSPTEIEEIVYASPLVKEAIALGLAHAVLGQAILLLVTLKDGDMLDLPLLEKHCKLYLPNFMQPADIKVLNTLPRNPNGKIDRPALKQQFAELFVTPIK